MFFKFFFFFKFFSLSFFEESVSQKIDRPLDQCETVIIHKIVDWIYRFWAQSFSIFINQWYTTSYEIFQKFPFIFYMALIGENSFEVFVGWMPNYHLIFAEIVFSNMHCLFANLCHLILMWNQKIQIIAFKGLHPFIFFQYFGTSCTYTPTTNVIKLFSFFFFFHPFSLFSTLPGLSV